jgi:hypothetical protein
MRLGQARTEPPPASLIWVCSNGRQNFIGADVVKNAACFIAPTPSAWQGPASGPLDAGFLRRIWNNGLQVPLAGDFRGVLLSGSAVAGISEAGEAEKHHGPGGGLENCPADGEVGRPVGNNRQVDTRSKV